MGVSMNLGNEQQATDINHSIVSQANGNVVNNFNCGISAETAMEICKCVVKAELAVYTQNAEVEAQKRLSEISEKTIDRITSLKEDLLQRFNEPAIQIALNETFKSYMASGDEELGDNLIDLLIERLNTEERTTDQALIDEARSIVPKLSSETVAFLTILVFSRLIFPYNRTQYDALIVKLAPFAGKLKDITSLDIAYLKQVGCGTGISAFSTTESLESSLLSSYDLFFRKNISLDTFNGITQKYPQLIGITQLNNFGYIISMFSMEQQSLYFNVTNTKAVTEAYHQAGKDFLLPIFEELKASAVPFSKEDVCTYHIQKDTRWKYAFDILKKQEVTSFVLNPVGVYIGIRQLTRICEKPIPMSIFYA